jgi:predicted nucleic-acid-binding protein
VRAGEMRIFCPATVIFETIHVLHGRARIPRTSVSWALNNLIAQPGFVMQHEVVVTAALEFWVNQPALDYADCYHLALTSELGMTGIYTFDQRMDRYPGVARVEP